MWGMPMNKSRSLIGCVVFVLGLSCSSDPPRPSNPSCAITGSCFDYTGASWRQGTSAQQACPAATGAFSATLGCTPKDRFGSCTLSSGQPTEYVVRFYAPLTDAVARGICSSYQGTYGP